jgi:tRNA A-37 threonylcarbamoyl transferase component Bud32
MRLVVHPNYQELEPLLLRLPELFERGKVLYKSRNELRIVEVPGYTLNVKRYRVPILLNRIAYSFFRSSKANRAYEFALKLQQNGFGTPDPIAYLEYQSCGLLRQSYFVSKHIADFRMMREFADGSDIAGREDILEALGVFIAQLHEAGILHLDLSVGNILFQKEGNDVRFWLVDLNRMRFCKIDQELGCKNFERLRGNQEFFRALATAYARERGFDQEQCLESILKHQEKSVESFRAKSARKKKLRKWKLRR